jgi:hypothetical protein
MSGALIFGITISRNQGMGNRCLAQVGYALTALVAVVETIAASVLFLTALPTTLLISDLSDKMITWLDSSFFSMGWSVVDFFLNPFCKYLVADEVSAREIVNSGDLMHFPEDSVIHVRRFF